METWARACSGVATAVLLMGSAAGFATLYLNEERARRFARPLAWVRRCGLPVGVGALLLGVGLRVADGSPLSNAGDRAAVVALVAGSLWLAPRLCYLLRAGQRAVEWAGLIPLIILTGISAGRWPDGDDSAPVLLIGTLIAAGIALWAAGQGLDALRANRKMDRLAAAVAFAGLTANLVVVGWVNWRVWGTPIGTAVASQNAQSAPLNLTALWLVSAAGLVLGRRSVRLTSALDLLLAALLVGLALSVHWALPFS
jgi:hypothetical protein